MPACKRALLSVHDKSGLLELATALAAREVELVATGGTTRYLREHGFNVTPIEKVTGFPEILGGRVKTLHPKIFGGLLARREIELDLHELQTHGIATFDLVVVNLYPFREIVTQPDTTLADALENIDIGGVALIRAAAKNFPHVAVLTQPKQYPAALAEFEREGGAFTSSTRRQLARAAFAYTSAYDAAINNYLRESDDATNAELPETFVVTLERVQALRYGENPHQRAGFYRDSMSRATGLMSATQLQGKELSYNNIADADAALNLVRRFTAPCCTIIKHANPCGVGVGENLLQAYHRAKSTDPVSAFGGIVGCNREVDAAAAQAIAELFTEVVLAPRYSDAALQIFAHKKNVRVLAVPDLAELPHASWEMKSVAGGVLVQEQDLLPDNEQAFRCVTARAPAAEEMPALLLGWKIVRWVKSNAIVLCNAEQTLGLGAGQMSRVDSVRLALEKARAAQLTLTGATLASDAFFPFADGIELAAQAGITAVIQPGGSLRDAEVIAAANAHQIAMLFTGVRHFRH